LSAEAAEWHRYARENLEAGRLCMDAKLARSAIQNAQQAAEKAIKAIGIQVGLPLHRTHSMARLSGHLAEAGHDVPIRADECDLLDSVYLPSKYPMAGVAPAFEATPDLARMCLGIADRLVRHAEATISAGPAGATDT